MRGLVLGTAGHIDHGKTSLVKALTGVDTDRLKEEKDRGITIELGFAELARPGLPRFGVVDVPGHEAFVRAMVAGAAGMDVVLLVVAADEGVMPQTREHLAIVDLLGVPELVVALTKCDAVDEEWLELVESVVAEVLEGTRYSGASMVRTSAKIGQGLDELVEALAESAERIRPGGGSDVTRLPLDRVFTIQGTGTVVTGTLWTGELRVGERVRILPQDLEARVRGVQVHGRTVEGASAGDRTAVALTGAGGDRDLVARGATIVTHPNWAPTWMLTARVRLLADTGWSLEHNQRVHVHLGTTDVLARCALLDGGGLSAGESGWVQLRLEEPLVARARDRLVLRAYSPVTTIGGGVVAEPLPPKRNTLDDETRQALESLVDGTVEEGLRALLLLAGWNGVATPDLTILSGYPPDPVERGLGVTVTAGAVVAAGRVFGPEVRDLAEQRLIARVRELHEKESLRPSVTLASVRSAVPGWAPRALADSVLEALVASDELEAVGGEIRASGYVPVLTSEQVEVSRRLEKLFDEYGLAAPFVAEYPDDLASRPDLWGLLHHLEQKGLVCQVTDGLFVARSHIDLGIERVREALGGREALGPSDFRDALDVTRKHLIPLLNYLDSEGVTIRSGEGRSVRSD